MNSKLMQQRARVYAPAVREIMVDVGEGYPAILFHPPDSKRLGLRISVRKLAEQKRCTTKPARIEHKRLMTPSGKPNAYLGAIEPVSSGSSGGIQFRQMISFFDSLTSAA